MKKNICFFASLLVLGLQSCDDFLEREPLDFGDENAYFKNAEDLKVFVNDFYSALPTNSSLWGGLYSQDNQSDNQSAAYAQSLFYKGEKKTVNINSSEWNFSRLRAINYYINKVEGKLAAGQLTDRPDYVNHYLGEGYFFRAYDYFRLLRNFGDAPIITVMLDDDQALLTEKSIRYPRNEVARQIIADLDKAAELMMASAPESGRVTRDAALLLKARVALYEGTWERYHAGTCFVPGNDKWPGKDTWSAFAFKAGSAEAEVEYFLDQAIDAAGKVADARALSTDYQGMFNKDQVFPEGNEVILARYYKTGVLSHSCSAYLRAGGGCGLTRAAVNTFLMANGQPIYATNSGYHGDTTPYDEVADRDSRLSGSIRAAGENIVTTQVDGKNVNDTIYYYKPPLRAAGNEKSTTGYDLNKWLSNDAEQRIQYNCTTTVPLMRAAEAYLIYLEAYYERNHTLDANCDKYWKALRTRAGVDADYMATIAATDLAQENDLGVYSRGTLVDATLYNIRRERRCELIAEGLRLDDLKRWRSLDNMVNYQPEGMNLWDEVYKMYDRSDLDEKIVSQSSVSKYMRPLQVSATSAAYDGYTFPKPHYLEPIPISEFLLTGGGVAANSPLYQNPGWPHDADGTADYTYDCD
ncbi:MAG: RagB/SusD family nutrient uptake outer membrane protein [Alloprevotella sp.]|nr:RagB/SusD family nutrient uptake outer membrane protein [Alloprevotella sp.]